MNTRIRFAWFRLNADGVLIALLGLVSGLDLLSPEREGIVRHLGYIPMTFYVWTVLLFVGGLLMLYGFIKHTMGAELLGRLLIILAILLQAVRYSVAAGLQDNETVRSYLIFIMVTLTFTARASALLSKSGLAVIIGGHDDGRQ